MRVDIPKSGVARLADPEFRAAYLANEHEARIKTGKLACSLVVLLMPVGVVFDWIAYRGYLTAFLELRLLCALLVGGLWGLHYVPMGMKTLRAVQMWIVFLPALSICLMILLVGEPASRYYAGLNLILLAVSAVGHWAFWDALISVAGALVFYLGTELWMLAHSARSSFEETVLGFGMELFKNAAPALATNLTFIGMTGVIVVVGNLVFNRLAFREFESRFELDHNRRELEKTNRRLVELDQVKSRFFANISHELRTPLTLLLAPLETLLHDTKRPLDTQARDWLQTMYANGLRLLKLINDLLDLVRLESGKMEVSREPVAIEEFVKGMANSVRKVADDKHVHLQATSAEGMGAVMVDRDKLEKILLNLLFNAIKFTPAGGRVEVNAVRDNNHWVLTVQDTGMGIPAEKLPFVFQRFWQADTSAQRKYHGAGIGLALVKELVEIQEGQASVESEAGKGTTFTVRLPYLKAEAPVGAAEPVAASRTPQSADGEWVTGLYRRAELFPSMNPLQESLRPVETTVAQDRPRVLIADDEPDMLRFLRSQLERAFQVLEAADGQQAVEKAAQFLPDIVLCDMMMPGKDGLQVCREIRQRLSTRGIPLLLITARADEETKLAALEAGASDFLSKPFSTTELNVRLRNLVESYQFQKKLARQNQILESTIEQLKETETQLVASEKMASLGRLSAGIMHEISNPINFMKTGLHVLQAKIDLLPESERGEYSEMLADLADGIKRVQEIVLAVRPFAHPREGKLNVRLDKVVGTALKLLSNDLKDGVTVRQDLADNHMVWADHNKLVQVLVNLVQNAAYAVKQKPFANGDQATVWIESKIDNAADKLVIRDNGVGIKLENISKVFEPFFTTKDVGEGTGLGLSICYKIIEEHEGRISVRSEPGQFCEFTIELPKPKSALAA